MAVLKREEIVSLVNQGQTVTYRKGNSTIVIDSISKIPADDAQITQDSSQVLSSTNLSEIRINQVPSNNQVPIFSRVANEFKFTPLPLIAEAVVFKYGETINGVPILGEMRIPAITRTENGRLLAFCEAHRDNTADAGVIGIICRYSDDCGVTWNKFPNEWVAKYDSIWMFGNPTVVTKGKRIWLFFNKQRQDDNATKFINGTATDTRRVMVTYSDDEGESWAPFVEITNTAKPAGHSWHACGPGNALVTASGRIVVPYNSFPVGTLAHAGVFYSDNNGLTWQLGAQTSNTATESVVVQLANGNLIMNSRREGSDPATTRLEFVSTDQGATWGSGAAASLNDPKCQGSMLRIGNFRVFSNPNSTSSRVNLTLKKENGIAWSVGSKISYTTENAGYSSLVEVADGWLVGCLWEQGISTSSRICFTARPIALID